MRKILTIFTILVLLIVGLFIGPNFVDWNQHKPLAVQKINEATGMDAALDGDISMAFFPAPRVRIKDVTIKAPGDSAQAPLAKLDALKIDLALAPLFSKKIVVEDITLDKPQINIRTDKDGKANWQTPQIQQRLNQKTSDKNEESNTEKTQAQNFSLTLSEIKINDGYLSLEDELNKKTIRIENINTKVETEGLKGPFDIDGSLNIDGNKIKISGDVDMPDAKTKTSKAELDIEIDGAKIEFKGALNTAKPFNINGNLEADVKSLSAALAPLKIASVPAQFNQFQTQGALKANTEKFSYTGMTFSTGNGKIVGAVSGKRDAESGALDINIDFDEIPGSGAMNGNVVLRKQGLSFKAKGEAKSLNALMGFAGVSPPKNMPFSSAVFDLSGKNVDQAMMLDESTIKLDGMPITLSGSLTKRSGGTDLLSVKLATDTLDLVGGKLAPKNTDSSSGGTKTNFSAPKISLPFDLNFDVAAKTLMTKQGTINNISAKGSLTGDTLKLTRLDIADLAGATVNARGTIESLSTLAGIDLYTSLKTNNIQTTLDTLKPGMKGIPPAVKKLDLTTTLKGNSDSLSVTSTATTLGATFDVSMPVKTPFATPQITTMDIRTRHPSATDLMNAFAPNAPKYASLKRPMDIKTNSITLSDGKVSVGNISGKIADATINGNLNIGTGGAKPSVYGTLRFGNLILETGKHKSNKSTSSKNNSSASSDKWSSAPLDTNWLSSANINLDISADSLTYETWHLSNPKLVFKLGNGRLDIDNLNAGLYGGSATLNGSLAGTQDGLSMALTPTLKNIQIEPLIQSAVGKKALSGKGVINFNGAFNGTGKSQKSLVSNLSGNGNATGSDIVINGLDLSKFVSAFSGDLKVGTTALGLLESTGKGGSTQFDTLDGAYTMTNGVATLSKLDLDGAQASMTGQGTVNLPRWHINTEHTITLNNLEDVPSFTIRLNGPLDNPVRGMAEGAINNYLQKKLGKKLQKILGDQDVIGGEAGKIINNLFGLPSTPSQQQQNTQPTEQAPANDNTAPQPRQPTTEDAVEDAVRGLMQGLF